jgi:hypothetical protein
VGNNEFWFVLRKCYWFKEPRRNIIPCESRIAIIRVIGSFVPEYCQSSLWAVKVWPYTCSIDVIYAFLLLDHPLVLMMQACVLLFLPNWCLFCILPVYLGCAPLRFLINWFNHKKLERWVDMITLTVSVCGSASSLDDVFSFFYSGYRAK